MRKAILALLFVICLTGLIYLSAVWYFSSRIDLFSDDTCFERGGQYDYQNHVCEL